MKKNLACIALTLLMILFLTYCKVDIGTMVDDYNSNFVEDTTERDKITTYPSPGDDNFTEDKMLDDEYFVWSDATLNLCAPENCADYSWIVTDPDDDTETPISIHHFDQSIYDSSDEWFERTFYIHIPDSGLSSNKVYIITLRVTGEEGDSYIDKAAIIVYQHLVL